MSEQAPAPEAPQRRRLPVWVWLLIALCAILVAALIFVAVTYLMPANSQSNAASPQPKPTPTTTEQPAPAETTKPATPAPVVLPGCEILHPELYATSAALSLRLPESEIKYGDVGFGEFATLFGPATQTALSGATQSLGCIYPTNIEGGVWMYTMELPAAPRETFIAALRADSDFVETSSGGTQMFVWEEVLDGGHWASAFTTHTFVGDVWIANYSPNPPDGYVPIATAAIRAANSGLG